MNFKVKLINNTRYRG